MRNVGCDECESEESQNLLHESSLGNRFVGIIVVDGAYK